MEIYIVSHCLLNPLTRVKGIRRPNPYNTENKNIIQLPCPEIIYFGANRRENTKGRMDSTGYRQFCRALFLPYADMIEMLAKDGHTITITGVPKSPSCGALTVNVGGQTCEGNSCKCAPVEKVEEGQGIFFEEIKAELTQRHVSFKMTE